MNGHVAKPIRMEQLYEQLVACLPTWQPKEQPLSSGLPAEGDKKTDAAPTPEFPGIDAAVGLTHVGKMPLYLRLLAKFRDTHGKVFEKEYAQAKNAGDWGTQVRMAHSLKGVARTLGAFDLGEAAARLEEAAMSKDGEACAERLAQTLAQLQIVLEGLSSI
jgi:two-component system sensor histidine kinase/response regulator